LGFLFGFFDKVSFLFGCSVFIKNRFVSGSSSWQNLGFGSVHSRWVRVHSHLYYKCLVQYLNDHSGESRILSADQTQGATRPNVESFSERPVGLQRVIPIRQQFRRGNANRLEVLLKFSLLEMPCTAHRNSERIPINSHSPAWQNQDPARSPPPRSAPALNMTIIGNDMPQIQPVDSLANYH